MKFAILFLIASTALALSNGDRSDNTVKLAKKDGGFRFPTEDEDNPNSKNYRFKDISNEEIPQNSKPEQNQPAQPAEDDNPFKKFKDNEGNLCFDYMDNELVDIPVECMKPIFCNYEYPANKGLFCRKIQIDKDNWTKDDVVNKVRSHDCVTAAICKPEDIYNKPAWLV